MPDNKPETVETKSAAPSRRDLFDIAGALAVPALMGVATEATAATVGPLKAGPQIYQSIGVEPVINCRGTFTIIGATIELPEVRAAMDAASQHYAQLDEVAMGVGQRLADITGAEWGMVSAGCAAGLKHVTAACVSGGNPEKLIRIPHIESLEKNEVVIPRSSRSVYDHAVRNIGVKIIVVETAEQMEKALGPRTAMIYLTAGGPTVNGPMSLENVARMAKPLNIPILVDAAAENLTIPNVHLQRGATIVAYSGGKAIRGPQCAGLLLGKKDLLMAAWQASSPHHGPGRDNKVGREETLGMLAAVEAWVKRDHEGEWKTWLGYCDTIAKKVSTIPGVTTSVREPQGLSNRSPMLIISWDPEKLNVSGEEIAEEVARTNPRIALGAGPIGKMNRREYEETGTSINVTPWQMQPGDDKVVAERLHQVLSKQRPRKNIAAPSANISGRWDVQIDYFSSTSHHSLFIEQDGNKIHGSHKTDFATNEMAGLIDGSDVKMRSASVAKEGGDFVPFLFAGTVSGDTITGPVYFGEYLSAKFTAKRHKYPQGGTGKIVVPGGPPLAN